MKKVLSLIITAVLLISISGCSGKGTDTPVKTDPTPTVTQTPQNTTTPVPQTKEFTIDNLITALKDGGFQVAKVGLLADMVGAKEGYLYSVNGINIEINIYDLNSKNPLTVENLKSAQESGKIKMNLQPGAGDPYEVAARNGNLIIAAFDKHPEKDKILSVFNGLK